MFASFSSLLLLGLPGGSMQDIYPGALLGSIPVKEEGGSRVAEGEGDQQRGPNNDLG